MNKLTANEIDLLARIQASPELRILFFRQVKGLKWFDVLQEAGYFKAENIPAPIPAKEVGYVQIPRWDAVEYLVNTVHELSNESAKEYVPRFLEIIVAGTRYAQDNDFSNYHVWWQFAKILFKIPCEVLTPDDLGVVDYWLDDKYERGLVTDVIGVKWLPLLLANDNEHLLSLAYRLLDILFEVRFSTEKDAKRVSIRFSDYTAEKVTESIADVAGRRLGKRAVLVLQSKITRLLDELENDTWSAVWQPAIEKHEQNKYHHDAENVLIEVYRNTLCGYMAVNPAEACEYISSLLNCPYQTIKRVAIYCIGKYYESCKSFTDTLLDENYFQANYRHEIWHFLNQHYGGFSEVQKQKVFALIQLEVQTDNDGLVIEGASAYKRSIWLIAIKDFGDEELLRYQEALTVSKTKPENPDFSSYMTVVWGGHHSPYSVEELGALSISELAKTLNEYKGSKDWSEQGIEGLTQALKQVFKNTPLKYCYLLHSFSNLDLTYINSIIEAYSDLWSDKIKLPWDDLLQYLLEYITSILDQPRLRCCLASAQQGDGIIVDCNRIVSAIARFFESGAKSDDHAFPAKYHNNIEVILKNLLEQLAGEEFKHDSDAVSKAINSPRGKCIEALINLTLCACRLEDRSSKTDSDHSKIWARYQGYFDVELDRSNKGEYEFATLVTNYLPNFLYMSREWVLDHLPRIFDHSDYLKWSCAIQGYSYVGLVYPEIYGFLKEQGDFLLALDDNTLKDRVRERLIEHIVVAYFDNFEILDEKNSLIVDLINRCFFSELSHFIWFIWIKYTKNDESLRRKVYELWPLLLANLDLSREEDRKLASKLCHWASFINHIDEQRMELLITIAPYADEAYNSYGLLTELARISEEQPFEVNQIWQQMLQGCVPEYPDEAIRTILNNLVSSGSDGIREARNIVSQYLKKGSTGPSMCLKEILNS